MVEAVFAQAVALGVLCIVFVQGGDILEYFRPSPKLPKELNEFLATVQEHKGDFQLIREAAEKIKNKRNGKTVVEEDILGLKQTETPYYEHKRLQRAWPDDRPRNDIYPYMYSKQQSNKNVNANNNDIRIEPRSDIGAIERSSDKYPGRRFVEMKSVEDEEDDEDDGRDNIFGNNNYKNNPRRSIKKREIEIDVKNDGKVIKRIREQDVSSKSLVLNIHPKNSERTNNIKQNNIQNEDQAKPKMIPQELPLAEKMKDNEFKSNFENLFHENENLNTDRSLTSQDMNKKLFYQVTYPDSEYIAQAPLNNMQETQQNSLNVENGDINQPQNNNLQENIDNNLSQSNNLQPNIENNMPQNIQESNFGYIPNNPIQPAPVDNTLLKKNSESETESGFENIQSVVLDNDNSLDTFSNIQLEEKPEKRQLIDVPNVEGNENINLPESYNNIQVKNNFDRSIADISMSQGGFENNAEGYQLVEQSTTKLFSENCAEGPALIQEKNGRFFLDRNEAAVHECAPKTCEHEQPNNCCEEEKIKEMEKKIEEVDHKVASDGTADLKNELVREEMKIQEEEAKMQEMERKIGGLEGEIKQGAAVSNPKDDEIGEVEDKIDEEEGKIEEIEENLEYIEEKMGEKSSESKAEQETLKDEIKKVQVAEEKIAEEAKKIEEHEKQLSENVEHKPGKTTTESQALAVDNSVLKFQKNIKQSDLLALPNDVLSDGNNCPGVVNSGDPIEASGGVKPLKPKVDTIEIIEDGMGHGIPEVKFYTGDMSLVDNSIKRTERALTLANVKKIRPAKVKKVYLIHNNDDEDEEFATIKVPKRHDKKRKKKKKKHHHHHHHKPAIEEYVDSDYVEKFNEEDTNNSDLIPAFHSRHLQAVYDVYRDTEDIEDYEEDQEEHSEKNKVTQRSNSIEGDYNDDEESVETKPKKDKFAKIKKKSENEFGDPVETTKFDEYFDADYGNNKKDAGYHEEETPKYKQEKPEPHEIFEETFGFDNTRSSPQNSHVEKRARVGHRKKPKKIPPKLKKVEEEPKIVKDIFPHLKQFKKIKNQTQVKPNKSKKSVRVGLIDKAAQPKLPKFVVDDRIQQENIRKRSLDSRKVQRSNQNKFPVSTRNFFVKPNRRNHAKYGIERRRQFNNNQKKRAEPYVPDSIYSGLTVSLAIPKGAGMTETIVESLNRIGKDAPHKEEQCSEAPKGKENEEISKSAAEPTGAETTEFGANVGNVCDEDNNTTPVVLETMLAIVPEMELDNNTAKPNNNNNMINKAEAEAENSNNANNATNNADAQEKPTGVCIQTASHSKMDEILNGKLPMKLVNDVKTKIKEVPNLNKRFEHGLLKNLKMDSLLNSNSSQGTDSVVEIEKLTQAVGDIMKKIAETASCQALPRPVQEYLHYLTKNDKGDVLSKAKEMEDMKFNDNENPDSYLYEQSLHEKVNVMKELLDRYNKLPENCKVRAEPVKEYIENHLGMLSNMTSESNFHGVKRSYDINEVMLEEKNEQSLDEEVLFQNNRDRVNKRDVNSYKQSKQYQKLVDAVSRIRHKRENEKLLGELFGGNGQGEDTGGGYESPQVYSV